jgi:hypothetical protein
MVDSRSKKGRQETTLLPVAASIVGCVTKRFLDSRSRSARLTGKRILTDPRATYNMSQPSN